MRRLTSCLIIIFIMTTIFSGCSTPQNNISDGRYKIDIPGPAGSVPSLSFRLEAPLTDLPDEVPVYQMINPDITTEYVKALGAKLGLSGEVTEDKSGFGMQDEKSGAYLAVCKPTGTFKYEIASKIYPKTHPILPSDEEALKIATDFLVERGLLPEGRSAYKVDIGGGTYEAPAHLLVSFTSCIHATGPGARMGVRIGNQGEVVQIFINPTNPGMLPIYEIITLKSFEEAFQDMKNNKKYYAPPGTETVKINEVAIAYWLEPIDKGQEFVVPVYTIKGTCLNSSGEKVEGGFSEVVEAIK